MPKAKLYHYGKGIIVIKCPANHFHYIYTETLNRQRHKWKFNGDFEKPTFSPSINERTGYFVDKKCKGDDKWLKENSYHCHFIVTNGMIHFCGDCSHDLKNQTLPLPEVE